MLREKSGWSIFISVPVARANPVSIILSAWYAGKKPPSELLSCHEKIACPMAVWCRQSSLKSKGGKNVAERKQGRTGRKEFRQGRFNQNCPQIRHNGDCRSYRFCLCLFY
jgi:hypothetical protein